MANSCPKMNTDTEFQYNIIDENNIDDISPSVNAALKKIAEREGYVKTKIYKRTVSSDGGNYFGALYEINIKDDTAGENREINLFVKHALDLKDNFKLISISEVYTKEIFLYRDLAKIFTKLQNEAHIPPSERFKMVPSYNIENTNDAIILENMAKKGFKTYGKTELMSKRFAKLCIQQLARFHGLSFVMEKRMPIYFDHKIKSLKQSVAFDDHFKVLAKKALNLSTKKLDSKLKDRLEKGWEKITDNYMKYKQGDITSVKCLCHGDFKINNIMFKEVEGDVKEVIAVDYQLIYYGLPVVDFIYFIFIGTDKKLRKDHMNELKDVYHDSLKKFLLYFDIDIDVVYPRKTFEKDYEDALICGLLSTAMLMPFLFTTHTPDFSKEDIMTMSINVDDKFYEIFQGVVEDFIDWGYL